jgi:hypothetical protein
VILHSSYVKLPENIHMDSPRLPFLNGDVHSSYGSQPFSQGESHMDKAEENHQHHPYPLVMSK